MAKSTKSKTFEQSMQALEEIIEQMESGELELDQALKSFQQGVELTTHCQSLLDNAKQKVQMLVGEGEGASLEDFDKGDENN